VKKTHNNQKSTDKKLMSNVIYVAAPQTTTIRTHPQKANIALVSGDLEMTF